MTRKILNYVCLVTLVAFAPACSQKNAIVGYWQWGDVQSFFEFRADGVFVSHGESASKVTGRYSFLSSGKVEIAIAGGSAPKTILVSIKGDDMTLTENKFTLKLHRVDPSKISTSSYEHEFAQELNEWIVVPATNQPPKP